MPNFECCRFGALTWLQCGPLIASNTHIFVLLVAISEKESNWFSQCFYIEVEQCKYGILWWSGRGWGGSTAHEWMTNVNCDVTIECFYCVCSYLFVYLRFALCSFGALNWWCTFGIFGTFGWWWCVSGWNFGWWGFWCIRHFHKIGSTTKNTNDLVIPRFSAWAYLQADWVIHPDLISETIVIWSIKLWVQILTILFSLQQMHAIFFFIFNFSSVFSSVLCAESQLVISMVLFTRLDCLYNLVMRCAQCAHHNIRYTQNVPDYCYTNNTYTEYSNGNKIVGIVLFR